MMEKHPPSSDIGEAWRAAREAYRAAVRSHALYARTRKRMSLMHPHAAARLHCKLKDLEYASVEVHLAAVERLLALAGISFSYEEGEA